MYSCTILPPTPRVALVSFESLSDDDVGVLGDLGSLFCLKFHNV